MDWIADGSIRLRSQQFADERVWGEALERLQPSSEVIGVDEVLVVENEPESGGSFCSIGYLPGLHSDTV